MNKKINFLEPNEKILFQIREGMCSRGCSYCYEKTKPKTEMAFDIIEHGFRMLESLDIKEAELIGSEPTEYSKWDDLIKLARQQGISLIVYTSGLHLNRLDNDVVKELILHVMFKPNIVFMDGIKRLLDRGLFIYLRVNFDVRDLGDKEIIYSFLEQLPQQYHKQISLKYSFTAKTENVTIEYTNIDTFKKIKPKFLEFCEEMHDRYPDVMMCAERPIFKCCFTTEEQKEYSYAGLNSKCWMEYTIYKDGKIALCPPVENLIPKRKIETGEQLVSAIKKIRGNRDKLIKKPSFTVCENCEFRHDASCQGGCFSYKL